MIAAALAITLAYAQPAPIIDPLPRRAFLGAQVTPDPALGGLVLGNIFPDTTASASSLKTGDVLLEIKGTPTPSAGAVGAILRDEPAGTTIKAKIRRDGQEQMVDMKLVGRPKDAGTPTVEVIYDQVVSQGERMRTIITKPRKAGKYPVVFFIQGLFFGSVEAGLTQPGYIGDFLRVFADDYVTLRVEKPGCGDSEGGTNETVTFWREADIYVQALRAIKLYDYVDADSIYIFGHSMGGVMGPIAASREPVAGVCAYGTAAEPWGQYMIRNTHRQALIGGATEEQANASRQGQRLFVELCFEKGLSPLQAAAANPAVAPHVRGTTSADGEIYVARSWKFHQELANANLDAFWKQLDCRVLALYGASDFVSFEDDHQRIAEMTKHGTFVKVEGADHGFAKKKDFAESMRDWSTPGGETHPGVMQAFKDWMEQK